MAPPKGRKPVRWDQDAPTLARLAVVTSMMLQGARPFQIAETLGYSLRTAKRDIARARQLMRLEAIDDILTARDQSIAQLREIQKTAWAEYRNANNDSKTRMAALKEARECEAEIIALQGTKSPAGVDITSKGERIGFSLDELSDEELAAIATGRTKVK